MDERDLQPCRRRLDGFRPTDLGVADPLAAHGPAVRRKLPRRLLPVIELKDPEPILVALVPGQRGRHAFVPTLAKPGGHARRHSGAQLFGGVFAALRIHEGGVVAMGKSELRDFGVGLPNLLDGEHFLRPGADRRRIDPALRHRFGGAGPDAATAHNQRDSSGEHPDDECEWNPSRRARHPPTDLPQNLIKSR